MLPDQQVKQWAVFLHLSQFLSYLIPLAGVVVPLAIWLVKKDQVPGLDNPWAQRYELADQRFHLRSHWTDIGFHWDRLFDLAPLGDLRDCLSNCGSHQC
jgi:hypothetical protein